MKKNWLAILLIPIAFPTAAAECDIPELWHTLDAAEKAVNECHQRLRGSNVDNATVGTCIQAKASLIQHATVFEVCLQDAISTSALLGDDLHEFIERGEKMNDLQRVNNAMIKARTAALQNGGDLKAGIFQNNGRGNPGRANEDCSDANLQAGVARGLQEC